MKSTGLLIAESLAGLALAILFGYNANPSLIETIVYLAYLGLALGMYFLSQRQAIAPQQKEVLATK